MKYEKIVMEIVLFEDTDIITASPISFEASGAGIDESFDIFWNS